MLNVKLYWKILLSLPLLDLGPTKGFWVLKVSLV